jgi:Metallo-peptidase family M12
VNIKKGSVSLLFLFAAAAAFLEARAPEGGPNVILRPADSTIPLTDPEDSSVLRQQAVVVDIRLARKDTTTLQFPRFDGPALKLVRTSRRTSLYDSVVWVGRVEGQEASVVILVAGQNVLIGKVVTQPTLRQPAEYYEIQYLGNGLHVLRKYDPSTLAPDSNPIAPKIDRTTWDGPRSAESAGVSKAAFGRSISVPPPPCSRDDGTTIDALVVYTKAAKDKAAALDKSVGAQAIEMAIIHYIEEANDSYARSKITPQQLRLVHTEEVSYNENQWGDAAIDADKLQRKGGDLQGVHDTRERVGADVVGLIVEYTKKQTDDKGCGQAFLMEDPGTDFERFAFAAIPRRCAQRIIGLAHEFGHIMGARHDWENDRNEDNPRKPFPFSHGYVHLPTVADPGPPFRTVMAKNDVCNKHRCDLVPYWSNPNVRFPDPSTGIPGSPMGETDPAKVLEEPTDNATTLNNTASIVAKFRCSQN